MNLDPLFKPETMAVFGVSSTNFQHPANVIYFKNLHRYPVRVFAVNPKGGNIHGEKIYRNLSEVPEKIDLAVVATRAQFVPGIIQECIDNKAGAAAVISGGFKEAGREDLQDSIVSMARAADFPFIGPNCLGIYVPMHIDTFFLPVERMVKPDIGNVAFVSQSGGILVDQMIKFTNEHVGISKAVSIGNKALLGEVDMMRYLAGDPETKVISFYIEGFGKEEGRHFAQSISDCGKPVIVIKAGKSPRGMKAVSSHTASLAGNQASFSAALAQSGIVEAETEFEHVSFCEALSAYQSPIDGNIGVVTGSGGHGAMAVDACWVHGLSVPMISDEQQREIRRNLSPAIQAIASLSNPIDLTGSANDDDFATCTRALAGNGMIDCIIALLLPYLPGISLDLGSRLSDISKQVNIPLIAYVPHEEKYGMLIEGFELNGVPVSPSIEGAVLMAKALRRNKPC